MTDTLQSWREKLFRLPQCCKAKGEKPQSVIILQPEMERCSKQRRLLIFNSPIIENDTSLMRGQFTMLNFSNKGELETNMMKEESESVRQFESIILMTREHENDKAQGMV
jgi:hypothetical protein